MCADNTIAHTYIVMTLHRATGVSAAHWSFIPLFYLQPACHQLLVTLRHLFSGLFVSNGLTFLYLLLSH
ncbi:hypothetical protein AOQ84DRAFT_213581 [Glonium stellatum]|uniref:Uncharacterized protein n=1 Tax=Glonium stellatum TaxID=574774 RepID=A0A8E2F589_9PEZI|nr:hypothetical protein AOQ84DRAFT_213581 [Glonium stellatum]